jgi:hypothetical protein
MAVLLSYCSFYLQCSSVKKKHFLVLKLLFSAPWIFSQECNRYGKVRTDAAKSADQLNFLLSLFVGTSVYIFMNA